MNYYQRLKDIREDKGYDQKEIAQKLETTQQQISKYENGIQMMGIDKYIKLAKIYNISLDYLAGIIDEPKTLDGKPYTYISQSGNSGIQINQTGNGSITINEKEKNEKHSRKRR